MKKQHPDKPVTVKLLNPERTPLTKEKLRELSGLELSDEKAEETVASIHLFAKRLYDCIRQEQHICIDNQHVVNLIPKKKKAA